MAHGGLRKNSGRPSGAIGKKSLEQKIVEAEFKQMIMRNFQSLLTAQLNLALGLSYLIHKDPEAHTYRIVEDPEEMVRIFDEMGATGNMNQDYYITTKDPNNQAITSLLNRVLGKPAIYKNQPRDY